MHWLAVAVALLALALLLVGDRLRRRRVEARAYLKGVRYVLSDDPDGAIEALSDAARLGSPEAYETYLALGALLRRTGDLSRAIRLHRNMLLRPSLAPERRGEVERELAHDYRRGGMLHEAEAAYRSLAERGDRSSAEGLRDVLVEQGRLADAAAEQRRLGGAGEDPLLAHLLAEQARSELAEDAARARATAREAVAASARSADALLALAEAEGALGERSSAREAIGRALDADPESALLAWPALAAAGEPAAALALVESRLGARPDDPSLHFLRGRLLHASGRPAEALAALRRALDLDSTGEATLSMRELLRDAQSPSPDELAGRHDLMVAALVRRARPVRCKRCSAEAPTRQWRCKRCGAFESFAADRT